MSSTALGISRRCKTGGFSPIQSMCYYDGDILPDDNTLLTVGHRLFLVL